MTATDPRAWCARTTAELIADPVTLDARSCRPGPMWGDGLCIVPECGEIRTATGLGLCWTHAHVYRLLEHWPRAA